MLKNKKNSNSNNNSTSNANDSMNQSSSTFVKSNKRYLILTKISET